VQYPQIVNRLKSLLVNSPKVTVFIVETLTLQRIAAAIAA
jgi:hypothetical protein